MAAEELVGSDPRVISMDRYVGLFTEYLQTYEFSQISQIASRILSPLPNNATFLSSSNSRFNEHVSIQVHSSDLIDFDSTLAFYVIHHPGLLLPLFERAAKQVYLAVVLVLSINSPRGSNVVPPHQSIKFHVRITYLPPISELSKMTISDIRACDVSTLVQVTGTVVRTGGIRMLEESKTYECLNNKCRARFTVCADIEQDNMLAQPRVCVAGNGCKSTNIVEVEGSRVCIDYQEIKLQV
jgi:DNA helicase MCM9